MNLNEAENLKQPLTKADLMTACRVCFTQDITRVGLSESDISEEGRMLYQMAFMSALEWDARRILARTA